MTERLDSGNLLNICFKLRSEFWIAVIERGDKELLQIRILNCLLEDQNRSGLRSIIVASTPRIEINVSQRVRPGLCLGDHHFGPKSEILCNDARLDLRRLRLRIVKIIITHVGLWPSNSTLDVIGTYHEHTNSSINRTDSRPVF